MKRPNWEHASYGAVDVAELDEKDLRWLCGCGLAKQYATSKAYPICSCGLRMRILDHTRLGYVSVLERPHVTHGVRRLRIVGLTKAELDALNQITAGWNAFVALPRCHPMELQEGCTFVHGLQQLIMVRAAVRAHPDRFTYLPEFPLAAGKAAR